MKKYILFGSYCENVLERRTPHRDAHLAGLKHQQEVGILITLGPTQDLTKVFGIYEADDEATDERKQEEETYRKEKKTNEKKMK